MKYHHCSYSIAEKKCPLTYWKDEIVKYQPKVNEHIDIICSHSAPSFCFPYDKGPIVSYYADYDSTLLEDIDKERSTLDLVYNDYKDEITHWYYGHFHASQRQIINNINFTLLNIAEVVLHYVDDNN